MHKNKKVTFEGNNAIHWFPTELRDASHKAQNRYRTKVAKRWANAISKLEHSQEKKKPITDTEEKNPKADTIKAKKH